MGIGRIDAEGLKLEAWNLHGTRHFYG